MTTSTLTTTRLQERIAAPHGRVDRENGIIYGVKILGRISRNNREYTAEAIANAAGLYEGVAVFADHTGRAGQTNERSVRDKIGWLSGVKVVSESLVGNLHLLLTDPLAAKILEVAEKNPRQLGLSHVAEGVTRREGGRLIVEEIKSVRSVDIVTDPATTSGLFESVNMRDEYPADQQAFASALTAPSYAHLRNPFRLREADDMGGVGEMPVDQPGDDGEETKPVDPPEIDDTGSRASRKVNELIPLVMKMKDVDVRLRVSVVNALMALLEELPESYSRRDLDGAIRRIMSRLPDKAEAAAMERAGQSSESLTRYLTGEARGGVGLRESASESKARSFARSIT